MFQNIKSLCCGLKQSSLFCFRFGFHFCWVFLFPNNNPYFPPTQACTGSGKTLAFLIPTFEIMCRALEEGISRRPGSLQLMVGAAIIAPTRELATQIYEVFGTYLKTAKMEICQRRGCECFDRWGCKLSLRRVSKNLVNLTFVGILYNSL